jgi:Uma2 family endonuclease
MLKILEERDAITVPRWVTDLASFRRWTESDDCPHKYPLGWLRGDVWIDMTKEQLFTHLLVKTRISMKLSLIVEEKRLGLYLGDGLLLTNVQADVSGNPDGTFISYESLRAGRVKLVEGRRGGYTEVEGSPDMVLEIVSESSVKKDCKLLRTAYWEAGIGEYWLVDARDARPEFTLFRHGSKGYVAVRKKNGWSRSATFGASFRLIRTESELGHPEFSLESGKST